MNNDTAIYSFCPAGKNTVTVNHPQLNSVFYAVVCSSTYRRTRAVRTVDVFALLVLFLLTTSSNHLSSSRSGKAMFTAVLEVSATLNQINDIGL